MSDDRDEFTSSILNASDFHSLQSCVRTTFAYKDSRISLEKSSEPASSESDSLSSMRLLTAWSTQSGYVSKDLMNLLSQLTFIKAGTVDEGNTWTAQIVMNGMEEPESWTLNPRYQHICTGDGKMTSARL